MKKRRPIRNCLEGMILTEEMAGKIIGILICVANKQPLSDDFQSTAEHISKVWTDRAVSRFLEVEFKAGDPTPTIYDLTDEGTESGYCPQ